MEPTSCPVAMSIAVYTVPDALKTHSRKPPHQLRVIRCCWQKTELSTESGWLQGSRLGVRPLLEPHPVAPMMIIKNNNMETANVPTDGLFITFSIFRIELLKV